MTVAELIEKLKDVDPDIVVCIGWEGIVNKVEWVKVAKWDGFIVNEDGDDSEFSVPAFILGDNS